jgi:monoamine oxidase
MSVRRRPILRLLMSLLLLAFPATAIAQAVEHDVIIIGAGAAGLYAAYELDMMGFDVLILEGRPRHGGRLRHEVTLGTTSIDEIAEGVTGTNNWHYDDIVALDPNRLVEILTETSSANRLYSVNGSTVLATDVTRSKDPEIYDYWDFNDDVYSYSGPDIDLETHLCNTRGAHTNQYMCRGSHAGFHLFVHGFPSGEYTGKLEDMGTRSYVEEGNLWTLGGGEYAFATSTWLDTLEELYFNPILSKITYRADVVAVDASGANVSVTAKNCGNCHGSDYPAGSTPGSHAGYDPEPLSTHTAQIALVTVPLGVLKNDDIAFTPVLSATKQNAIDGLGFGTGGKLFLRFSSRVWPATTTNFMTEGGYCGWAWDQSYKGGDGDKIVICYSVAELAENLDALPDDNARIAAALSDLDGMYPGTPFTDAFVEGYWKRMDDMRHTRGTYSYPTVGSYPTDGSPSLREDLAAPEGNVYFSGEATSNNHPSTVIGAMESGLRAAGEIDAAIVPVPEPSFFIMVLAGGGCVLALARLRGVPLVP